MSAEVTIIPTLGFARGSIVTHKSGGGNLLVVRQLDNTTAVLAVEGDSGGTIRLREYPSASLRQLLPSNLATRGSDVINEAPNRRDGLPGREVR